MGKGTTLVERTVAVVVEANPFLMLRFRGVVVRVLLPNPGRSDHIYKCATYRRIWMRIRVLRRAQICPAHGTRRLYPWHDNYSGPGPKNRVIQSTRRGRL